MILLTLWASSSTCPQTVPTDGHTAACASAHFFVPLDVNLEEDAVPELAAEVCGAVEITRSIQHEIAE